MSTPKETNFFLEGNEKGLDWYRQCFPERAQEYGETSTNYSKHPAMPGVPERMHECLPGIKLLYLVRDPIDRTLSHYVHSRHDGLTEMPVEKALMPPEESHFVQTSRYYLQIAQYLDYYPRDRVLILESERLRNDRETVMEEVFAFLEVDAVGDEVDFSTEHHSTERKLHPGLSTFLHETASGQFLKSMGKAVFPSVLIDRLLQPVRSSIKRPTLGEELERTLQSYLQEDVQKLRSLTGNDFASWSL
jgi:hypothetical protein